MKTAGMSTTQQVGHSVTIKVCCCKKSCMVFDINILLPLDEGNRFLGYADDDNDSVYLS
jgi:hypothetical protein